MKPKSRSPLISKRYLRMWEHPVVNNRQMALQEGLGTKHLGTLVAREKKGCVSTLGRPGLTVGCVIFILLPWLQRWRRWQVTLLVHIERGLEPEGGRAQVAPVRAAIGVAQVALQVFHQSLASVRHLTANAAVVVLVVLARSTGCHSHQVSLAVVVIFSLVWKHQGTLGAWVHLKTSLIVSAQVQ